MGFTHGLDPWVDPSQPGQKIFWPKPTQIRKSRPMPSLTMTPPIFFSKGGTTNPGRAAAQANAALETQWDTRYRVKRWLIDFSCWFQDWRFFSCWFILKIWIVKIWLISQQTDSSVEKYSLVEKIGRKNILLKEMYKETRTDQWEQFLLYRFVVS